MWIPEESIIDLIIRGLVVYIVLFVLLRFVGKKHIGELSPFDLVVLLIISETVDGSLIGDDHSLTGGLISAATLVALVQVVGYLTWRFKGVESFVDGNPRVLIRHGNIDQDVLQSEQVTRAELLEALRREGHTAISKVRFAFLETDGSISVGSRTNLKKPGSQAQHRRSRHVALKKGRLRETSKKTLAQERRPRK